MLVAPRSLYTECLRDWLWYRRVVLRADQRGHVRRGLQLAILHHHVSTLYRESGGHAQR
jgi:hypothetical protein